MHIFLSNPLFCEKKISKNFEASPSSKFAENGRPEPLWSRGFSVQVTELVIFKLEKQEAKGYIIYFPLRKHMQICFDHNFSKSQPIDLKFCTLFNLGTLYKLQLTKTRYAARIQQKTHFSKTSEMPAGTASHKNTSQILPLDL